LPCGIRVRVEEHFVCGQHIMLFCPLYCLLDRYVVGLE
jgi:hypothetical protein